LLSILSAACNQAPQSTPQASSQPSTSANPMSESFTPGTAPSGPPADCADAPTWLVDAISKGILVPGAYLSNAYIGPASAFSSGPADLFTDAFAEAWWVAGRLNGVGVEPELGAWVTNRTAEEVAGQIFAVNASASRYTEWGDGVTERIVGEGLPAVQACVGPMPST
jgi:hypothetical protein